jgi:hypothetical protein
VVSSISPFFSYNIVHRPFLSLSLLSVLDPC